MSCQPSTLHVTSPSICLCHFTIYLPMSSHHLLDLVSHLKMTDLSKLKLYLKLEILFFEKFTYVYTKNLIFIKNKNKRIFTFTFKAKTIKPITSVTPVTSNWIKCYLMFDWSRLEWAILTNMTVEMRMISLMVTLGTLATHRHHNSGHSHVLWPPRLLPPSLHIHSRWEQKQKKTLTFVFRSIYDEIPNFLACNPLKKNNSLLKRLFSLPFNLPL